jgi:predicted RNA-binding protein with PUA-like domain
MYKTTESGFWLVKSEPTSYSIDHLKKDREAAWTGVRNYQARNFMREMRKGDTVLFYHSSCEIPGIYGIAKVSIEAEPDQTQFDKKSPYYEPRSTREKPVWECATIRFAKKLQKPLPLGAMKIDPILRDMHVLQKGSRLSVTPVSEREFKRVEEIAG